MSTRSRQQAALNRARIKELETIVAQREHTIEGLRKHAKRQFDTFKATIDIISAMAEAPSPIRGTKAGEITPYIYRQAIVSALCPQSGLDGSPIGKKQYRYHEGTYTPEGRSYCPLCGGPATLADMPLAEHGGREGICGSTDCDNSFPWGQRLVATGVKDA